MSDDPFLSPADRAESHDTRNPALQRQVLSETDFHLKTQRLAESLLDELTSPNGTLKKGTDLQRVEKGLSAAKQVIDSLARARNKIHEDNLEQKFEEAVILSARELPREHRDKFLENLENHLAETPGLNS